ncbi:MAG: polysaccharide deacetylase family protein [Calditrichaeota bacterium]|nr:polysaccharide deacetylase family protein [Calditrichota bacterium]
MQFLHKTGFQTISVNDIYSQTAKTGEKLVLTFDDADISVYENAFPIMKKFGFVGTIFVITDFVGKPDTWDANPIGKHSLQMNWQQIRELVENGWSVGSHTVSHRDLTSLSENDLLRELMESKRILENEINANVSVISYPFGRFNCNVAKKTLEAGYDKGFVLGNFSFPDEKIQKMAIPRLGVYLIDFLGAFARKLKGSKFEFLKQNVISRFSVGSILWKRIFS